MKNNFKRLIKSKWIATVTRQKYDNTIQDIEIFKDPTSKEIQDMKDTTNNGAIRGVISDDNIVYIWDGNILHDNLNYPSIDVNNWILFSVDSQDTEWEVNNYDHTLKKIYDAFIKCQGTLRLIGDFNKPFEIMCSDIQEGEDEEEGGCNWGFENFSEFETYMKEKEEKEEN